MYIYSAGADEFAIMELCEDFFVNPFSSVLGHNAGHFNYVHATCTYIGTEVKELNEAHIVER